MSNRREKPTLTYRRDFMQHKVLYFMLIPFFFFFFMMTILPILISVVISFTNYNMFEAPTFAGVDNYIRMLVDDDVFMISLKNTIAFAVITGPLSYVFCFLMAWLINEFTVKARVLLTFIFYAPSLSSSLYFIWTFIFNGDSYGLVNGILLSLGIINDPIQWLSDPSTNLIVLMLIQLWMSLGTGFLSFIAGFQSIDKSLYESGMIDGVRNRFQELIYITLPMVKPQMLFGAIMQITTSFSVSTISEQLCGFPSTNYSAHTLVLHIKDVGLARSEMGYACTVAVALFLITLLFKRCIDFAFQYIKSD